MRNKEFQQTCPCLKMIFLFQSRVKAVLTKQVTHQTMNDGTHHHQNHLAYAGNLAFLCARFVRDVLLCYSFIFCCFS